MNIINKFRYEKGVAASTVIDIVTSMLELHHHTPPSMAKYNDYLQIAKSKHLQDAYLERTNKSYVAPLQLDSITDVDGRIYPIKFTVLPLKSILRNAFTNQSLVDYLSQQQQQQSSHQHPNPTIKGPLDSKIASRIRGLIKVEVYADDTQYSPGFFNSAQKYTCVYISISDIPFHYRARSDTIDIYMLINAKKLKQLNLKDQNGALFGILRQEIERINLKGIKLRTSAGECFRMEVTVSTVLGDNLAIYPLLGFSGSFRNNSFVCRFCGARGSSKEGDDTQELFIRRKLVDGTTVSDLQQFGVRPERGDFVFDRLQGINRWNIAPPDLVTQPCNFQLKFVTITFFRCMIWPKALCRSFSSSLSPQSSTLRSSILQPEESGSQPIERSSKERLRRLFSLKEHLTSSGSKATAKKVRQRERVASTN